MLEFVVIVESSADARTATKLAERVLVEKVDWLEPDLLENLFQWQGLEEKTEHSCWKDIGSIIECAKASGLHIPRYRDHRNTEPLKADGASAMKILNLIRLLHRKRNRQIEAVIFIRDLDNQPERRQGIEQARRLAHMEQQPKLEIIIGTADRMREAWVLNGFIPSNSEEIRILEDIKTKLKFDPCADAHKLRSNSWEEPDRVRNPKVVVERLTGGDSLREQLCWEETSLELLRAKGKHTGLTAYLHEIEQLISVIRK